MRISYRCILGVFYSILIKEAYCLIFEFIDSSLYSFQIVYFLYFFYILRYFSECNDGFNGVNCSRMCIYPSYGLKCQSECACSNDSCHFAKGCLNESTSKCLI